jgi:hypothetical protein
LVVTVEAAGAGAAIADVDAASATMIPSCFMPCLVCPRAMVGNALTKH